MTSKIVDRQRNVSQDLINVHRMPLATQDGGVQPVTVHITSPVLNSEKKARLNSTFDGDLSKMASNGTFNALIAKSRQNQSPSPGHQRSNEALPFMKQASRLYQSVDRRMPMKQTLFAKNNESMEEMLIRKFRQKYIDSNSAFVHDSWVKEAKIELLSTVSSLRASRLGIIETKKNRIFASSFKDKTSHT